MTRVLFVDDEPILLRAIERALRTRSRLWTATFVTSASAALALLDCESFDVIVSDIGMPEMDGVTLLGHVRERHPHMARLVLSGHAGSEERARAVVAIHQWLSKPCPLVKLVDTIDRLQWARTLIDDPEILARVCAVGSLPSTPSVFQKVNEAMLRETSVSEVVSLVETDIALTSKLLQLVNSAFYSEPERVSSVRRAAEMLGLDRLRELLLAEHVVRCGPEADAVAARGAYVATLSRAFASSSEDDAFVAGLLHDVATLVIGATSATPTLHARLGGLVLGTWGLPQEIACAVAYHRDPEGAPDPRNRILLAVALADSLVRELDSPENPSHIVDGRAVALGLVPLDCRKQARTLCSPIGGRGR